MLFVRALVLSLLLLHPRLLFAGLVWSDRPTSSAVKAIRACEFDGSNVHDLYSSASDPRGVIVDLAADRVYFCDRFTSTASSGEINSVPLAGGPRLQHLTGLNRPADLRFDSRNRILYWCEENAGLIRRASLLVAGGTLTPQVVFSSLPSPYYLDFDLDAAKLYWGINGSSIFSGPLAGGTPDAALYSSGQNMCGVAVEPNAGMIYWCERDARVIRRRLIAGGTIETLYSGLDTPHGLVLDIPARKLYWVDTGTGNVGGFNARGVSRGHMDGAVAGAAEIIVAGTANNQPWDIDLDPRTTNYTAWVGRFFRRDAGAAITGWMADPDLDQVNNLGEYASGTAPWESNTAPVAHVLIVDIGGIDYPAIRFRRRSNAADLNYVVQVSTDLLNWNDNSGGLVTVDVSVEPADDAGLQWVTVRSAVAVDDAPQQFLRVRVESF